MSDMWTDRLSEYLDGELDAVERAELERHLAGCDECSATLEQLRHVVVRAQALEDRPPPADLWPGIAARIGAESGRGAGAADAGPSDLELERIRRRRGLEGRRVAFSLPQLAAASVALMVLSAGGAWLLSQARTPGASGSAAPTPVATRVPGTGFASSYDAAVAELEGILRESRDRLDTATVRVIEENLLIIDRAISEAQRALAEDPESIYLNEHLAVTMRQKLEFLRQAAEIAAAS